MERTIVMIEKISIVQPADLGGALVALSAMVIGSGLVYTVVEVCMTVPLVTELFA